MKESKKTVVENLSAIVGEVIGVDKPHVVIDIHEKLEILKQNGELPLFDKYMADILEAHRTGETNLTVDFINALLRYDKRRLEEIKNENESYFDAESYRFHDIKSPTTEEIAEINKAYNDFMIKK